MMVRRQPLRTLQLLQRPGGDGGVDFRHQAHGVGESYHDLLVVALVVVVQLPPAAVLEPLVQHLVAADLKRPHLWGDTLGVLLAVDVNSPVMVSFRRRIFRIAAARGNGILAGDGVVGDGILQQGEIKS